MWFSLSNKLNASAFANSVLPTPVGPKNRKEPIGRFGSFIFAFALLIASETKSIASCCPFTLFAKFVLKLSNLFFCVSNNLVTGTFVHLLTIDAISSSSIVSLIKRSFKLFS
ncbi:Uncharacterised protein [Chlamydia abortus]|nr:Uncharacterised protein [Chlamydia abortus]SGA33494.1 Uncharacterised protein [Chlamydia abortus]